MNEHPAVGYWECVVPGDWQGVPWIMVEPDCHDNRAILPDTQVIAMSHPSHAPGKSGLFWQGPWGAFLNYFRRNHVSH